MYEPPIIQDSSHESNDLRNVTDYAKFR